MKTLFKDALGGLLGILLAGAMLTISIGLAYLVIWVVSYHIVLVWLVVIGIVFLILVGINKAFGIL